MMRPWVEDYTLLAFNTIDSTNLEARRMVGNHCKGSFVIVAAEQSNGLGSNARSWVSPEGNLYFSILMQTGAKVSRCPQICFIVAVAIYNAIEQFIGTNNSEKYNIEFKWPNDILLNGKKIAGILIESLSRDGLNYLVIGIGINVGVVPDLGSAVDKIHFPPTSFVKEGVVGHVSSGELFSMLDLVITCFDKLYHKWLADGNFFTIRNFWLERSFGLNKQIEIVDGSHKMRGVFRDLALDGGLVLERDDGHLEYLYSGSLFGV